MAVGRFWSIILGITKTFVSLTIKVKIVRERAKTAEVGTGKLKMCRKTHGDPYFFLVDTLDMTVMFLMLVFGNSQYISNILNSYSNLKKILKF